MYWNLKGSFFVARLIFTLLHSYADRIRSHLAASRLQTACDLWTSYVQPDEHKEIYTWKMPHDLSLITWTQITISSTSNWQLILCGCRVPTWRFVLSLLTEALFVSSAASFVVLEETAPRCVAPPLETVLCLAARPQLVAFHLFFLTHLLSLCQVGLWDHLQRGSSISSLLVICSESPSDHENWLMFDGKQRLTSELGQIFHLRGFLSPPDPSFSPPRCRLSVKRCDHTRCVHLSLLTTELFWLLRSAPTLLPLEFVCDFWTKQALNMLVFFHQVEIQFSY